MTIEDLIYYEQATRIICKRYENEVKMSDGTLNPNHEAYALFNKYNTIRLKLMLEMEKQLDEIDKKL